MKRLQSFRGQQKHLDTTCRTTLPTGWWKRSSFPNKASVSALFTGSSCWNCLWLFAVRLWTDSPRASLRPLRGIFSRSGAWTWTSPAADSATVNWASVPGSGANKLSFHLDGNRLVNSSCFSFFFYTFPQPEVAHFNPWDLKQLCLNTYLHMWESDLSVWCEVELSGFITSAVSACGNLLHIHQQELMWAEQRFVRRSSNMSKLKVWVLFLWCFISIRSDVDFLRNSWI